MHSLSTFRLSGPNPEVKKICIDQCLGKYYCIMMNLSKARSWQTSLVCSKYSLRVWRESQSRKFFLFYPHLSLETVIPTLKLLKFTEVCKIDMKISFSWKLVTYFINWVLPLIPSLLQRYCARKTIFRI